MQMTVHLEWEEQQIEAEVDMKSHIEKDEDGFNQLYVDDLIIDSVCIDGISMDPDNYPNGLMEAIREKAVDSL
jgi:hypothetical protein